MLAFTASVLRSSFFYAWDGCQLKIKGCAFTIMLTKIVNVTKLREFMEHVITPVKAYNYRVAQSIAGGLFMALSAWISIHTVPVAITMQTFALFVLALTMPPRICFASIVFYLAFATIGLPILSLGSNPLWFIGPTAGYLAAFPFAGYAMAAICSKPNASVLRQVVGAALALLIIYAFGSLWLSLFVGWNVAFHSGVLFFIQMDCLKLGLAIASLRGFRCFFA